MTNPFWGLSLNSKKPLVKTILVRSDGRIVIPKKIVDFIGIVEGTDLTFEEPKTKFNKRVIVQPSGRVVIPLEIRELLDIYEDTPLVFIANGGNILTVKTMNGEYFHIAIPA